ncbi:DUF1173 family protein [Acetobacter okinawensis]|uniref:DUF1173 family protein n=1 Tax=Acetobacter okinawensis TaxID=1076594 RepID=UPI001BA8BFEA|nr:DUF1173 family protein [Acetobacter okinawensis]MBS0988643.1 DUF1173 family protein [Acetobacter okinawensis]
MGDWITFPNGKKARRSWDSDVHKAPAWQALLRSAHDVHPRPFCDCLHQGKNLELVVRRSTRKEQGVIVEAYHLARMPNQGSLHGVDCPFHETDARLSGQAGYAAGVLKEMPDGRVRVALRRGLALRDTAHAPSAVERCHRSDHAASGFKATQQPRMTELGLLHLLWERSGTNLWHPGIGRARLWWQGMRQRVLDAAADIMVGQGSSLSEHLAMIGYGDKDGPALLRDKVQSCGKNWRILLLGKVDSLSVISSRKPEDGSARAHTALRFDGTRDYHLRVSTEESWFSRLSRRFPRAVAALQMKRTDRSIAVIGLVTATVQLRREAGKVSVWAWADDIALMEVEPETLIPVESSYELQIAQALVREKRAFIKPLRFDAASALVHPDFILTDTNAGRGTPMEVYGRDDDAYRARKAEKSAYYDATYGLKQWWSWDVVSNPDHWPPFPPAAGTRKERVRE